jgi:hypothetical protein
MKTILGAAASAAIILGLTACGGAASNPAPTTPTQSQIRTARDACKVTSTEYARLGDGGYTLTLQTPPKYSELGLPMTDVACILTGVSIPDSVVSEMDSTRALDGTQKASWDKFQASWTYHPDNGMRIILTESK